MIDMQKKLLLFLVFLFAAIILLYVPRFKQEKFEPNATDPTKIQLDGRPAFINFFSEGCSICRHMEGSILDLEKAYGEKVQFLRIDANDPRAARIVQETQVLALPTFLWITPSRELFMRKEGFVSPEDLKKFTEGVIKRESKSTGSMMPPGNQMPPDGQQMPPTDKMPPNDMQNMPPDKRMPPTDMPQMPPAGKMPPGRQMPPAEQGK